jgi:ATP-dependent Lhr-like helicase
VNLYEPVVVTSRPFSKCPAAQILRELARGGEHGANGERPHRGNREPQGDQSQGESEGTAVRTGDTTPSERAAMLRRPPHILVTTTESLYLLLTSDRTQQMLRTLRAEIVDEIHAIIGTRRGAHLALTLERLADVAEQPLPRIGLSATQTPIEEVARFLTAGDVRLDVKLVRR